jgi:hypothetical protein
MGIPPQITGLTGKQEPSLIDIMPTTGFMKTQLKTRNPLIGFQEGISEAAPAVLNALSADSSYRRMIMCRNDLRVKVLRAPKDKFKIHNSLIGVARNEKSIFQKPKNNHPLLIPADSNDIQRSNKLGVPK